MNISLSRRNPLVLVVIASVLMLAALVVRPQLASAAAGCTAPSTDYGTVSGSGLNGIVTSGATTNIWVRMAIPDTTDKSVLLEVDNSAGTPVACYTVNATASAVYTSAQSSASTYFNNNTTNWVNTAITAGTLPAGTYNLKLIGNAPNVVVDRILMTQDSGSCTPSGVGTNCTTVTDTTPPVGNITSPAASAQITGTQAITVSASDNTAVTGVTIFDGATQLGTATLSSGTSASGTWTYNWNTSGQTVGSSHSLTAHITDGTNPIVSGAVIVTIKDTTPPVISVVASGSIAQTSATITWTTNEAADSQVAYGTTTSYGSTSTLNSTKVTTHSVALTGLTANTTYHFKVTSKDATGNSASSADTTFKTLAPAGDTTKPTVSMTAPTTGSTVTGSGVTVSATAADDVGVAGVQFKVDGTNIGAEDTTAPYSVTWNTTTLSNGSHTLTAVARDAAGNTQTTTNVTVTVSNATTTFLPADINQDKVVDIRDFGLLKASFGQSGSSLGRVDINADGVVDIRDFGLLKASFGQTSN